TCSGAVSFCTQSGDICFENEQCCSGDCVKTGTNQNGTCGDVGGHGASQCNVAGTLCPPGNVQCDQSCCSRSCGPTGGLNGNNVCQNPSGCHPVGELCRADTDCCGLTCSKSNATDEFGRCSNKANACNQPGQICKAGGSNSCSTSNDCCEPPGLSSGT